MSLLDTASLIVTPNGYKEGKLYSVIPSDGSGDLSVTRATTATRVNSQGLVELVPYNLLEYSEQFNNGYWSTYQSNITANSTIAPNGTTTADTLTQSGAGGGSVYLSSLTYTGGAFTISCYVKKGTNNTFIMDSNPSSGYFGASFNLDTEVITFFGVTTNANIENLNNTWYRCSVTANASGSAYVAFGQNASVGSTLFIWGAQVNEGTLKPYQKTETRLNIPRLDYSNGTCPSILVEPQRTNVCVSSNNLNGWINQTGNTTLTRIQSGGVDGNAFDRLVTTGSGNQGRYVQFTALVGSYATFSVYLRGTGTVELGIYNAGQSALTSITLTSEWTRYEAKITTGIVGYIDWSIFVFGGNTTDVCCAQMEFAPYATSYIPTTSASVTRNADVISKTGISSLIGQTEGTLFVEFYNYANNTTQQGTPMQISASGFYTDAIYFEQYLGNWYCAIWNGGNQQFLASAGTLSEGWHKLAVAYKTNDIAYYVDGNLIATDTSASIPTCSRLYLGINGLSAFPEQMGIKASALWKTRLTNAQLATLTTI